MIMRYCALLTVLLVSLYLMAQQIQLTTMQASLTHIVNNNYGAGSDEMVSLGNLVQEVQGRVPWWLQGLVGLDDEENEASEGEPYSPTTADGHVYSQRLSRAWMLAVVPPGLELYGMLGVCIDPLFRVGSPAPVVFVQNHTPASTQLTAIQTQNLDFLTVSSTSPSLGTSELPTDLVEQLDLNSRPVSPAVMVQESPPAATGTKRSADKSPITCRIQKRTGPS